ncbi:MAG: TetR family transcriptional regulator [Neomegalonema sp.]|nr:TetR family transcriptional regulator [Neomegalonema sp.]
MARPSSFDKNDAIETAMNEIWRLGYDATSVKAMSERLGITRSSYYNAFGARETLYRAAIEKYCAQSPDRALSEPIDDRTVQQLISTIFRGACRVRAADPENRGCMLVKGLAELVSVHEELGPFIEQLFLGSIERLEALMQEAVAKGELPPETNPRTLALATQSALMGLNLLCKLVRTETELWAVAQTTLRGLGLYADPPAGS